MRVEIYSKPGCSLCEEARAVLERVRQRVPFELHEVDIRSDPALHARHRYDIPVVLLEGEVAFRHRVDEGELEERLRRGASAGIPVAPSGDRGE
jgi:glutaredoxin